MPSAPTLNYSTGSEMDDLKRSPPKERREPKVDDESLRVPLKRTDSIYAAGTPQLATTLGASTTKIPIRLNIPNAKPRVSIEQTIKPSKSSTDVRRKEVSDDVADPSKKEEKKEDRKKERRDRKEKSAPTTIQRNVSADNKPSRDQCLSWTWTDILPRLVAPYLTYQDILTVRRVCRIMYFSRRFRVVGVDFNPFAFIGESAVWHHVLPLAVRTCTPGALQKLSFKGCTMLTDTFYNALFSDATLLPSTILSVTVENQVIEANSPSAKDMDAKSECPDGASAVQSPQVASPTDVDDQKVDDDDKIVEIPSAPVKKLHCSLKTLCLDFCPQLTDKTLALLLTIHFPRLEKLSFQCVRSNMLTGEPFIRLLDKNLWPSFHQLDSSFTHMTLQSLDLASSFALARALDLGTTPKIKIAGSLASIAFFKVLGLDQVHQSFRKTIEMGDLEAVEKTVKYFEQAYITQVDSPGLKRMILCRLLRNQSIELLMNAPLTTAVAAEKMRKHDIVNKAKMQAAEDEKSEMKETESKVEPPISVVDNGGDSAASSNAKFSPTSGQGSEPKADTENVEEASPPTESAPRRVQASKDLAASVTRWTYPIYTAVRHGHRKIVEYLLKRSAEFNVVDYDGSTPLHVATIYACQASESSLSGNGGEMFGNLLNSEGDEDEVKRRSNIVKLLISWDCNVNALDVNSRKWPINAAAKYDNAALVDLLIEAGARVNFPGRICGNMAGESGPKGPLLVACEAEPVSKRAIKALVNAGADVVGMSSKGRLIGASPILTIYRKAPQMLEIFLKAIEPSKIHNKDRVVFDVLSELFSIAICKADLPTVKLLCSDIPELLQREHSIWSYPIHQVAKLQDPDTLQFIIEQYLEHGWAHYLTDPDTGGKTPLMAAALDNSFLGVQSLLEKGVDVDKTDKNGYTALMLSCENNLWAIAHLLIKAGANVNIRSTDDGHNALMLSIIDRQERIALKLLENSKEYGLDLNIVDNDGRSALMHACFFGLFKVAQELMARNCDVAIVDVHGQSADIILKKKIDSTGTTTTSGLRNSVARKFGKLSRLGRDRSLSSRMSRRGTEKWEDEIHDVIPSSSEKILRANTSLAASELIRFDASNVSVADGEKYTGLQDDEMMRELQERTKKAAQKLLKQIKELAKDQEHSPHLKINNGLPNSPKKSSASSRSSRSSVWSRSGSVVDK